MIYDFVKKIELKFGGEKRCDLNLLRAKINFYRMRSAKSELIGLLKAYLLTVTSIKL